MKAIKSLNTLLTESGDPLDQLVKNYDANRSKKASTTVSTDKTSNKTSANASSKASPGSKDAVLKIKGSYETTNPNIIAYKTGDRVYNFYIPTSRAFVYPVNGDAPIYKGNYSITGDVLTITGDGGTFKETITISTGALTSSNVSTTSDLKTAATAAIKNTTKNFDVNESTASHLLEAILAMTLQLGLTGNDAKAFMNEVVDRNTQNELKDAFSFGPANLTGYNLITAIVDYTISWKPESDDDNQMFIDLGNKFLFSVSPASADVAKQWANAVWNIIDDTIVTEDEETNAAFATMMLSPAGLAQVEAAWTKLRQNGAISTSKSMVEAVASEIDNDDSADLLRAVNRAQTGKLSAAAQTYLAAWKVK